jgi:hypothetical protein
MKSPNDKLHVITTDNTKPWPLCGNGFKAASGSAITLVLDRGVKLELADGTKLEGLVKL